MPLIGLSTAQAVLAGAAALPLWLVGTAVYRRWLHPLARVPGPFWASVTRLYGFYYNVVRDGEFYLEIERLHSIYGPVVRIGPNEVHLSEASNYDRIYYSGSKFGKDRSFYGALGDQTSMFSTASNDLHRRRRAPLNPFFSRRAVLELEDVVQDKARRLCDIVEAGLEAGRPVNLHDGFRGVSMDVITDYAFDDCWNQLGREDMGAWFGDMVRNSGRMFWILQQFPFLLRMVKAIPPETAKKLSPEVADMVSTQERAAAIAETVKRNVGKGVKPIRRTIFHQRFDPTQNEPSYQMPTIKMMGEEGFSLLTAASDTAGNAMTVATYHMLKNPDMGAALRRELAEAFPDPHASLPYMELEKLPYLTAVIKEAQRLSFGVVSRLPRVTPAGGAVFNGYFIPEGTVVGMSHYLMFRNPTAFPDPETFNPSRWLDDDKRAPEAVQVRNQAFVPFSRGPRMCIGQNLAMCELYVTIATLFRRFDDLRPICDGPLTYIDYFNVYHPREEQKLRVTGPKGLLVL